MRAEKKGRKKGRREERAAFMAFAYPNWEVAQQGRNVSEPKDTCMYVSIIFNNAPAFSENDTARRGSLYSAL
jgi:hypothetical protein